jgi:hypothetical protein
VKGGGARRSAYCGDQGAAGAVRNTCCWFRGTGCEALEQLVRGGWAQSTAGVWLGTGPQGEFKGELTVGQLQAEALNMGHMRCAMMRRQVGVVSSSLHTKWDTDMKVGHRHEQHLTG